MSQELIAPQGLIVAGPSLDYRWRRLALVVLLFGYGLYSAYDGFYRYPKENADFHRANPLALNLPHPALDIPFNQAFGIGLPPLSILFLAWVLYCSRGSYRFDGTTLSVPGHESIPIDAIRKIDKAKWDRKGIAYFEYQLPGSTKTGRLKLDDFIYQRIPTDQIFSFITEAVEGVKTPATDDSQQRIVCPYCGVQNLATASLCTSCGGALDLKDVVRES